MFDRHYVYNACLLAAAEGQDVGAFGNACGNTNNGQYQNNFYQGIAAQYGQRAEELGFERCWQRYTSRSNEWKERRF